jgi:hypothetical protein
LYSSDSPVTAQRLRKALLVLARIVAVDARALPLFERVEAELEITERHEAALARAIALAQKREKAATP